MCFLNFETDSNAETVRLQGKNDKGRRGGGGKKFGLLSSQGTDILRCLSRRTHLRLWKLSHISRILAG